MDNHSLSSVACCVCAALFVRCLRWSSLVPDSVSLVGSFSFEAAGPRLSASLLASSGLRKYSYEYTPV